MKKWYESKTIIFNIVCAVLGVFPMIDETLLLALGVTEPDRYFKILACVIPIINYFLRFITNKGIEAAKIK